MRDGRVHLGHLIDIKGGFYHIIDILDENEVKLKREDIEQVGGVRDAFNTEDYPTG